MNQISIDNTKIPGEKNSIALTLNGSAIRLIRLTWSVGKYLNYAANLIGYGPACPFKHIRKQRLEFRVLRSPWECNDVADVGHTRYELHHPFKSKSESRMWN